jgi:hypothetical protein
MEALLPLLLKFAVWGLGLFGGAASLENLLENYLMDHLPTWAKGLVVPVVALTFGVVANVYNGMPLSQALAAALTLGGLTTAIHNHPDLTSGELPPPPADAAGVPGVPAGQ